MAGEWMTAKIGDCFDLVGGYAFKSGEFIEHGIPVIKIKNVKANRMLLDDLSYVAPEFLKTRAEKVVQKGDLLITMSGNRFDGSPDTWVGKVAQFNEDRPFLLNQRVGILRPKKGAEVDRRFFAFSLSSHFYQTEFIAIATSSGGQANLSPSQILGAPIEYPPLAEQKAIAAVLGALDDKIELNRRMNATLEAMARALFQSWFVDFDPVRAKLDPDRSGPTPAALDPATAALFPDSFQDSELGHIPKGWGVKTADEISVVGIGKTPPRKEHHWFSENPEDVPWMSIRDLGEAGVFISKTTEFLTPEAVEKFRVRRIPDDTVVLSFKLTMGRVAITDGEMLSNEAIAHFRLNPETPFGSAYLYCYLKGFGYDQLGSTSSIATAINSDMVRGIKVLVPSKGVADAFEGMVAPLFAQMKTIQKQSRNLAILRDTLLPKLLSGELSIAIGQKEVETNV